MSRLPRFTLGAVLLVGLTGMLFGGLLMGLTACGSDKAAVPGREGGEKTIAKVRAERRLYDGAPPVIPHQPMGAACVTCHNEAGMNVPGLGFAPPSPHGETLGMKNQAAGGLARCQQCHVFQQIETPWVPSTFVGLRQDLRRGSRLYDGAPPVIPHKTFMRENCLACHSGPAAREEIRTSHPERTRCLQCHVEQVTTGELAF